MNRVNKIMKKMLAMTMVSMILSCTVLGCGDSNNSDIKVNITKEDTIKYTFEDRAYGVKFSVKYPKGWKIIELKATQATDTSEASPESGIKFQFDNTNDYVFGIEKVLNSPPVIEKGIYHTNDFETESGLKGRKYRNADNDNTSIFYIFNLDEKKEYVATVNMKTRLYESVKEDIEKVVKSLEIIE